ncbi:MAG: hypothetical protein K0Q49_2372 [Haloplasmataceae bacterium]|nr:hypothetical protein [Haloplasmataceae bacterium]
MIYLLTQQQAVENLNDLLKKIQENSVSLIELITAMGLALIIGLVIFFVYKFAFVGTVYSYSFNFSLILMLMITTTIILTISSNIVLSLGMVGALSIVRFRSALKDPIDIVYIFWSISVGIAIGSSQYLIATGASIFISLVIIILTLIKVKSKAYLLIINYDYSVDHEIKKVLKSRHIRIKSKYVKNNNVELTVEVKKGNENIFNQVKNINLVNNVSLLAFED